MTQIMRGIKFSTLSNKDGSFTILSPEKPKNKKAKRTLAKKRKDYMKSLTPEQRVKYLAYLNNRF